MLMTTAKKMDVERQELVAGQPLQTRTAPLCRMHVYDSAAYDGHPGKVETSTACASPAHIVAIATKNYIHTKYNFGPNRLYE